MEEIIDFVCKTTNGKSSRTNSQRKFPMNMIVQNTQTLPGKVLQLQAANWAPKFLAQPGIITSKQ
jgi:hypothetical protein